MGFSRSKKQPKKSRRNNADAFQGKGTQNSSGGSGSRSTNPESNNWQALGRHLPPGKTFADMRAPRRLRARFRLNMKDGAVRYVGLLLTEHERDRVGRYSDDEMLVTITDEKAARVRRQSTMEMLAQVPAEYVTVDVGPEWVDGGRRVPTVAEFMDKTRPQPTPEMAQKLPALWRTSISDALEVKYKLAYWASLPQGRMTFDILGDTVGPGANRNAPSSERAKMMRTFFQATCMEAPLYLCTQQTTAALLDAASVLDDWTPTDELLPHENGAFIMFDPAIPFSIEETGKFEGAEDYGAEGKRTYVELRGLVMTRIYFGTDEKEVPNPNAVLAVEIAKHPREFTARVKQWTERIHLSGLVGYPGNPLPLPHDLAGWNVDLPLSKHRAQWDGYDEGGGQAARWRQEDEMESRILGAFLLWIKQRILVHSERRADRAARKRIGNMSNKPNPESPIMLVELRAKDYIMPPDKEDKEAVEWHFRWVVRGHWRHNQRCGPGNKDRRPVYIEPYLKGPPDMPLKPPRAIVFAVTR